MRGLGIGLLGAGLVFVVASWISYQRRGEPDPTAAVVGMILCTGGAVVLTSHWSNSR